MVLLKGGLNIQIDGLVCLLTIPRFFARFFMRLNKMSKLCKSIMRIVNKIKNNRLDSLNIIITPHFVIWGFRKWQKNTLIKKSIIDNVRWIDSIYQRKSPILLIDWLTRRNREISFRLQRKLLLRVQTHLIILGATYSEFFWVVVFEKRWGKKWITNRISWNDKLKRVLRRYLL